MGSFFRPLTAARPSNQPACRRAFQQVDRLFDLVGVAVEYHMNMLGQDRTRTHDKAGLVGELCEAARYRPRLEAIELHGG